MLCHSKSWWQSLGELELVELQDLQELGLDLRLRGAGRRIRQRTSEIRLLDSLWNRSRRGTQRGTREVPFFKEESDVGRRATESLGQLTIKQTSDVERRATEST